MALLKFQDETGAEQFVHVGPDRPEVTIGRVRTCDLVTTNITVSRRHASVTFQGGKFVLRDLNSANGVFFNKQRVGELVLNDGDSLLVGSMPVFFELEPSDMKGQAASAAVTPSRDPVHARPTVAAPAPAAPGSQEASPAPKGGGTTPSAAARQPMPQPSPAAPAQRPAAQPASASRPPVAAAPKPAAVQTPGPAPQPAQPPKPVPAPAARPVVAAIPAEKPIVDAGGHPVSKQQEKVQRNVPAAFRADWKPSAAARPAPAVSRPSGQKQAVSQPASSKPVESRPADDDLDSTLVQQPGQPGQSVTPVVAASHKAVIGGEPSGRVAELEKALELERADRTQIAEALKMAEERYYDASERADNAEAALIDVRSEIDLIAQENREMAERADQLERDNADLMQEIDDLRRERTENFSSASGTQQQVSSLQAEVARMKADLARRELEVSSLKGELEQVRAAPQPASSGDLEAALRQISELKLSNKGYLKRIGRLMEEQEKAVPCGVVVTPEAIGVADRLVELAGDSADAAGLARSLVSELKAAGAAAETVSEMSSAIASLSDSVSDLRKLSTDMQMMLKPPVQD